MVDINNTNKLPPIKSNIVSKPKPQPVKKPIVNKPVVKTPSSTPKTKIIFKSCSQAHAASYHDMKRGQPGYRPGLDKDNDGIACELKPNKKSKRKK